MGTTDDNEAPIVFSFRLASLFQLLQFLFLVVCGYAILRCMHVLQRRSKKTKPIADKSLLSTDPSKSTTEESCVTTTELSHDYVRRRATNGNYDRFNLQGRRQRTQQSSAEVAKRVTSRPHDSFHRGFSNSPRSNYRVKRQGVPGVGRTVKGERGGGGGYGADIRYDYVTEGAVAASANQSFVESESQHAIVESRPDGGNLSDYEGSSYQTIGSNDQSFVDYNYMDEEGGGRGRRGVRVAAGRKDEREKESTHPFHQSFDSVNKEISKSDDSRVKSDEAIERPPRIKFSKQSAGVSCHRRFLAGTQEDGAYHPFPSSSDRLDCATQFVSREPSNVINLSPSVPKTYLDVDSSGGAGNGRGSDVLYSPMGVYPGLKPASKYVHPDDNDTKAESPPVRKKKVKKAQKPSPRSIKQSKTRDSKFASGSSGCTTGKRSTMTRHPSPKTSQATKTDKSLSRMRGEGTKNRMASNSHWGAPDLNMNYAATVSLQECGRELNRLILDTMRDYEDWGVAQPPPCRADLLSSSSPPPSWSSPPSSLSIRERPNSSPVDMVNISPAYQIPHWSNANDNKILTEPSFRYSVRPVVRRRSKNRPCYSKPVVLADLLKELEILTKRINHHYDHVEMVQDKERGGDGKTLARSYNCSAAVWDREDDDHASLKSCEDIVLSNRYSVTLSEASRTAYGNGKTHSVFSSRITSMRQSSPQDPKPRPPVVTTTVSQRKKVFEETCPVTLNDTEIVCYMELVPKLNHPTGGFQVFKLDTVPSYQEHDSSARETPELGSDRTFLKDDVRDNFSENRMSDSKEHWPKCGPERLYEARVGGTMEISYGDPELDQDTYIAGKSFNDATLGHICAVGNHGDNNKPGAQKDGYKTAMTLSPKKPMESTSNTKKTLPAKRGSYVANFHKTLRRKQSAQASSPVTKWKGFPSTMRCVPQAPTLNTNGSPPFKVDKGSGVSTRPVLKSCRGVQINTPTSSPNKDSYQGPITQNEHPAVYNEGPFQYIPDTPCSPNKASNYFHLGNPDKSKTPQDNTTNMFGCKTPNRKGQVKQVSDKRFAPSLFRNPEKRGLGCGSTNKMPAKQSTTFSSPTYNRRELNCSVMTPSSTPPHGPTESVRFEIKSTMRSRLGHIRGRQKQKDEYFLNRHNASENSLNQRAHFTFDNNTNLSPEPIDKRFDSDSGVEKNALTANGIRERTKTAPSPYAFQRKGKHDIRLNTIDDTSPYYAQRKRTPIKGLKLARKLEKILSPMDTRCSVTYGQSPSTEPSSNALQIRSRIAKKNVFGSYRQSRRPISFTQKKSRRKEDGGKRRASYRSPGIDRATYKKLPKPPILDKGRWTKFTKSNDSDAITPSPVSGFGCPGGGDTTLSEHSEIKDFQYHTRTLNPRSRSSPEFAAAARVLQKATSGRRRSVKRLGRGSLSETNPSGPSQVGPRKRFVKSPACSEKSDSGNSTFVVKKARSRSRSRRLRSDKSLHPNVAERRYEIRMKDKSLGVARFLRYCVPSTNGPGLEGGVEEEPGEEQEEEEGSSSSTGFLLDTLDEISESLSDDEMVYW